MKNKLAQKSKKLNQKKSWTRVQIYSLIILVGYLCTEFIANDTKFLDNMHPQWLYLSVLNIISLVFIFTRIGSFYSILTAFRKNMITLAFLSFLAISVVSIFQAINVFQSFEVLSRYITTFFVFLNGTLLLYQIKDKFHVLAKLIVFIILYQSIDLLLKFRSSLGGGNLDASILSLVEGFGNKNITSVGLLIKVPFLFFFLDRYKKGFWNILGLLVLAITVFDILLLNARASFISLGLITLIMLIFSTIYYFKIEREKTLLINLSKITGIIILAVIVNSFYFSTLKQSDDVVTGAYGSVAERLTTINISQNSIRITLWNWAYLLFKDNWVCGCGIGNYQIAILKYENETRSSFTISKHAHNDFLEIASETGIFGLISYSLIYFLFFISFLRVVFGCGDMRMKKLSVIALMGLTIYFVDAVFNFPHERPPIQLYFGITLALLVISYSVFKKQEFTKENIKSTRWALLPLLVILFGTVYVNSMELKFSVTQKFTKTIMSQNKKALLFENKEYKAAEIIDRFLDYPNINDAGMPITCTKAELLIREKRYENALEVLTYSKKANPYNFGDDKLRMDIFQATEQYDSAMYYGNLLLKALPNLSESSLNMGIIEYERGNIESAKKHFEKAISLNIYDYVSYENLGVILYNSKNYPLAIEYLTKVIDSKTTSTGKAELIRGWCYFFSGDKEKACADYQRSVNKKNALAVQYLEGCK